MAFYENVFIARQDVPATQVDTLADSLTAIVKEQGGEVTKKEYWGLRNLTYRIKKNRKGHYVLLNIDGPAAAVKELERNLRLNEDILRFITVRVDALEAGPSAVLQNRDRGDRDRDGRGGRGGGRFGDDRPRRDFGDRPRRDFGDRPRGDFGDRPRGDFGDRPRGDFGDRPPRGDTPGRSEGEE
jgi:small subunit ribosomal protein S6